MRRKAFLLSELVRRDLSVRYAGSFGGAAWTLLNPLVLCGLYSLVFSLIVRIPPPEGFRGTYAEFLLAGLLPWLGFQDALIQSSTSITNQAHLVKKVVFPLELLVAASVVSALLLQMAGVVVLAGLSAGFGAGRIHVIPLLAGVSLEVLLLIGPAFALAAVTVLFRDLTQILGPLLTIAFYLTPILYPESLVPPSLAFGLDANPLRDVAALFRAGLLGLEAPPAGRVLAWAAASCVLGFLGYRFFRRSRTAFADIL